MRLALAVVGMSAVLFAGGGAAQQGSASRYLVTWAGDADGAESDFLAVLDVAPGSSTFGQIVSTVAAGARDTLPHHTEHTFTPGRPLFANGFAGDRTFRFDLSDPRRPRLLGSIDAVPGLAFPHTFERLPNGNILATMQASGLAFQPPGGLAEFRDDGTLVRWASGGNDVDPGARAYSLVVLPAEDRVIVTCGRMVHPKYGTGSSALDHPGFVIQLWRLSDLRLLKTVALTTPPGARANIHLNPYEPRRLRTGEILFSTSGGGLFRISSVEPETFGAELVFDFGGGAFLPVLVDRFWIQAISSQRRVVALDVSNPRAPVEVSRLQFDDRQGPHWLSLDEPGHRIVMANGSGANEARLWMMHVDAATGRLALDESFRSPATDSRPGVSFERNEWPHGATGRAVPHGSVFIR